MAGVNNFKPIAVSGAANVITQATYEAMTTLIANGFVDGVAESAQVNKVLRQAVFGTAVLGEIISANNVDALDDGDLTAFKAKLITALNAALTSGILASNNNTFTKAQRGAVVTLSDGATITPDFSASNNFGLTVGGNRTLANPTNLVAGQSGIVKIIQDATGGRTLAYGAYWKFPGGTAPVLTTTANAVDVLAYYVESSTRITANLLKDVK